MRSLEGGEGCYLRLPGWFQAKTNRDFYQSLSEVASAGSDFKAAATICRPIA